MNTRFLTKLLQKAGTEVIEAFSDYIKGPNAINKTMPTLNKSELGKFVNKTIKPLVKDIDTTIITGRSKSKPQGIKTDLLGFLEDSLSKTDTYTIKSKKVKDKRGKFKAKKIIDTDTGKSVAAEGYKKREDQWKFEELDLNKFLTEELDDLRPGSSMRKANIGRAARGEREFLYEGYREPTINKLKEFTQRINEVASEYQPRFGEVDDIGSSAIRKVEKQVQKELNSDEVVRFLFNKLKGRTRGRNKIGSGDILNYLEKGTLGISGREAKRAVTDVDQMDLPLTMLGDTKFGQRGFKGEGPISGVQKIISGGQTGVDETGLIVGRKLGLDIGGTAPKNYKRNNIQNARLSTDDLKNNLKESDSSNYNVRTQDNILDSDGTVIFGDITSAGTKATINILKKVGKPFKINPSTGALKDFLSTNNIQTLNVAGNRGTKEGMVFANRAERVLTQALKKEKGQISPEADAWQRFTQAVKDDPESFMDYEINPETGIAQKIKRDPLAIRESELMPSGGGPTLQDVVRGRFSVMAENTPKPKPWQQEIIDQGGNVNLANIYSRDASSLLNTYRARLQGAFGSDFLGGFKTRKNTSTLLNIPPEEKALLSAEEKALVNRAEKVYMKKYYESKEAGYNHSAADELAREEVDAVMGQHALDEDFSFASPEKIFSEREQIQQIRDPKLRAAEELEELGSRITEPVDLRPSRQYSLNDLVPDPNIRKAIRERLTPEDLAQTIKAFNEQYYRTQGDLTRHISDIPLASPKQGARINPRALTRYTQDPELYMRDLDVDPRMDEILNPEGLQSDFMNFLLGENTYAKGGKVKAKKKTKFIPKIIKNRSIRGKKKTSKPLGVGAAQRGWGAVRSA